MKVGTVVYKYLLKHRLTEQYLENIRNTDVNRPSFSAFNELKNKRNKKRLIDFLGTFRIGHAFAWSNTKEGYLFWYNHSVALINEIKELARNEQINDKRW